MTWTSVSIDDGHVETGHYSFGIGTPAPATRQSSGGAASSEGLVGLAIQLVLVAALTLWVGALLLGGPAIRAGVAPAELATVRQVSPALALIAVLVRALEAAVQAPTLGRVMPTILAGRAGEMGTLLVAGAATIGLLAHPRTPIVATAAIVALTRASRRRPCRRGPASGYCDRRARRPFGGRGRVA